MRGLAGETTTAAKLNNARAAAHPPAPQSENGHHGFFLSASHPLQKL